MPRPSHARLRPALDDCEGVFTLSGLCANDVPRAAVEAFMRNPLLCRRALPGVYVAHTGSLSDRELDLCAVAYAGPRAILTSARALVLHGCREAPRSQERVFLLDGDVQRASRGFVRIVETYRLPEAASRQGIPVAPPVRAALDLARSSGDRRLVQAVWSELLRSRLVTVDELRDELAAGPRRGSALPRRVLAGLHAGARSKAELDALELFRRSDRIPEPLVNAHLYDEHGEWIACTDFFWRGVVSEVQSKLIHFALERWESDEARMARLASYGLLVLPVVPARLYRDWPRLEDEIARSIEFGARSTCRVTPGPPPAWWGNRMG